MIIKTQDTIDNVILPGSPIKSEAIKQKFTVETVNVLVQTVSNNVTKNHKTVQTDIDMRINDYKNRFDIVTKEIDVKNKELAQALTLANQRSGEIVNLKSTISNLDTTVKNLTEEISRRDNFITELQSTVTDLKTQVTSLQVEEKTKISSLTNEARNNILLALKNVESDKNTLIEQYKDMLKKEREEYTNNIKDTQKTIAELQSQLCRYLL